MKKLTPISGFPEFLPEEQIVIQSVLDTMRAVYEKFGFVPIETPAVERVEHLLEKGLQGKEVYLLRRLQEEEIGLSDLALHFDLTVPLARYVAQHYGKLTFPFKRYQIQPVWRGERPQAGRYRQFYQSDIDVIGDGTLSLIFDAEICAVIDAVFTQMQIGPFSIRLNHRKILQGVLGSVGISEQPLVYQAIKIVDEIEKQPLEKTAEAFERLGLNRKDCSSLLEFFSLSGSPDAVLKRLSSLSISTAFEAGVQDLREVVKGMQMLRVPDEHYTIDVKIARGLDYYTGTVYETTLQTHPQLGSICSGGRYDDLTGVFLDRKLPGVGTSIGVTRLIPQLMKEGILKPKGAAIAPILVTMQNPAHLSRYLEIASRLRARGMATEAYLERKSLGAQLRYADKKGFQLVLIADDPEFQQEKVLVKKMQTGEQKEVFLQTLEESISSMLSSK